MYHNNAVLEENWTPNTSLKNRIIFDIRFEVISSNLLKQNAVDIIVHPINKENKQKTDKRQRLR
jgi:hypothetical protein